MRPSLLLLALGLGGCEKNTVPGTTLTTNDTDSGEPMILTITDTSVFIPQDTSAAGPPDLTPDHWVYMSQIGSWNMASASPPYGDLAGTMRITEYVDTLDTALPVYECNVTYSLTGSEAGSHTCASCDFAVNVEFYVTAGDPSGCHDPDVPYTGTVWQLGMDEAAGALLLNFSGTDVWVNWFDATKAGATVSFSWETTLAIELEDTGGN
jgi:hypothetical protein